MSEKTDEVKKYLLKCRKTGHLCPTIREIGDACGISSTSVVAYHVDRLIEAGICYRDDNRRLHIHRSKVTQFKARVSQQTEDSIILEISPRAKVQLAAGKVYLIEVYENE